MNSKDGTISLIVKPVRSEALDAYRDRLGAEEHGVIDWASGLVAKKVDAAKIAANATDSALRAARLFQDALRDKVGEFEIEELTLSLAITAEGDIGIATAGVESSISVSFKRNPAKT